MRKPLPIALLAMASIVALSACTSGSGADSADTSSGGDTTAQQVTDDSPLKVLVGELNFDITDYCGDEPIVVAHLDGFGGNSWAQGKAALVTSLAESCDNVTEFKYVDAGGDPQAYIAAINSLVAQGVDIIETFNFFGQGPVPAFNAAQEMGTLTGTANAIPGNGTVPADFTSVVVPDFDSNAQQWVEFLTSAMGGEGKVAYIGGPAGNQFDAPQIAAIEQAIVDQGSGIELITKEPLVGAWDNATTQQVTAGLLQTTPDVDGIITSFTASGPSIVRAYEEAGVPLPAITGQSSSMEYVCLAHEKADDGLRVQSLDGTPNLHAINLAKLLAAKAGIDAPELGPTDDYTAVTLADYINTEKDILPDCDTTVPPGADLSIALDPAVLAEAFQ